MRPVAFANWPQPTGCKTSSYHQPLIPGHSRSHLPPVCISGCTLQLQRRDLLTKAEDGSLASIEQELRPALARPVVHASMALPPQSSCEAQQADAVLLPQGAAQQQQRWALGSCSSTRSISASLGGHLDRRSLLSAALVSAVATAGGTLHPGAAHALRTIELPNGQMVAMYEHGMSLAIVALRGSVPQQWIMDFKSSLGKYSGFTLGQRPQLEDIYKDLSDPTSKNSAGAADVVTLGDAWLAQAIRDRLVQPIANAESYRWWKQLSPRWQKLVRRNTSGQVDTTGEVYGAPYRWGATLIAYRKDRLLRRGGHVILDWPDLLQPQLQGRVALTGSSRELLGLALKTLGMGYNPSAAQLAAAGINQEVLRQRISLIRQQVRLFSSNDHVRALQAGDVWAIVGWSQDLTTLAERSNSVQAIVPLSGTSLFADLWVIPQGAQGGNLQSGPSPLLPSWLEFSLMPARVPGHPGLKSGAAPLLLPEPELVQSTASAAALLVPEYSAPGVASSELQPAGGQLDSGVALGAATIEEGLVLRHGEGYLPKDKDVLRRSEFLLPLSPAVVSMYRHALEAVSRNS